MPEIGEIVIATIKKTGDHGAYVSLDEYDNIQGFLHISEIAPGWVRKVTKYVKEGDKKVLLVKKIQAERAEIDLSLKQITKEQRKKKLLDVKRFEKEQGILKNIQDKIKLSVEEIDGLEEKLLSKYPSVYDAIIDIGTNNISVVDAGKPGKKDALDAIKDNPNEKIDISYLGAPKYRLSVVAQDFKTAEKTLKPVLEKIEKNSSKHNCVFKFSREESKKTGEG